MTATLAQWLEKIERYHPSEIELGLERLQQVWQKMACAVNATVVTVAGTNGKGSTCAYIDAILTAHGLTVGRYSSPHFHQFNERILLAQQPIDDAQLVSAFEAVDAARADIPLTYFEFTTLAAFYCYSQAQLDVWVLEVGLGGRLDAVNLIDADVAVLTSVGLDHQDYLGDTLMAIGREKAGICRAGKPFVLGLHEPPASVLDVAHTTGATVYQRGVAFDEVANGVRCGQTVYPVESINLPAINVATAVQAAALVLDLQVPKVTQALSQANLVGRMQQLLWQQQTVILDVAHNPEAAENLAKQLAGRQFAIVFAGLADKDLRGVVQALEPLAKAWHLASLGVPRGLSSEKIAERTQLQANCYDNPEQALAGALRSGENVLVCGSFYTVSAALTWLNSTTNE